MSENILKELCSKVLSLFKQTETKEENAKDVACNRLRVVLMQDRTNLTPELLQRMRKELVLLLSKYLEMDKDALELNLEQEGNQMALMLSIPVIRAKDEAEIEKALEEESETDEKQEEAPEDVDEVSSDEDNEDNEDEIEITEVDDEVKKEKTDEVEIETSEDY